ncbi:septum formation initiator family protein [Proteiniclasticum sp. SCR006]|uniref:Septum formation initiator family protein n=1 Tax=Proteiniclasticum aestuarii TaxID=2817862 RepID=A0A939HCY4_9CLOT|nr:septum formation initiator family protein [Proteiniclasticum aestuarii]MBO1265013.1 septum formation initiator family protein [Proteiniclasticum aestuarii]
MKIGKVFVRLALLLFAGVIVFTVYRQQIMMNNIEENIALQQEELVKVMEENEKLTNLVDSTLTEDYTIRSARSRLGLLRPGEIPVIDSSGD